MFVKFHPEYAMYGTYFVRLSSEKSHRAAIAVQPSPTEDPKTLRPQDPKTLNTVSTVPTYIGE